VRDAVDVAVSRDERTDADGEVVWTVRPTLYLLFFYRKNPVETMHLRKLIRQVKRPAKKGRAVLGFIHSSSAGFRIEGAALCPGHGAG
jgi:hypothetical protein